MTAHDHALVQTGQVAQRLFLVLGLEVLGVVERFHLDQDVDAPAVGQPVGEVGVVVGRAGPHDGAVLHLALGPGGLLVLIGLERCTHVVGVAHVIVGGRVERGTNAQLLGGFPDKA